jgi:hypothetical protein
MKHSGNKNIVSTNKYSKCKKCSIALAYCKLNLSEIQMKKQ